MYIKGFYQDNAIYLTENLDLAEGSQVFIKIRTKDDHIDIREWEIKTEDTRDLDLIKARDLMIRCFTYAHMEEAMLKKMERLNFSDYESARETLQSEVKLTFRQLKENFDQPTKTGLLRVLMHLAQKQINRGASPLVVFKHRNQLKAVLQAIPDLKFNPDPVHL